MDLQVHPVCCYAINMLKAPSVISFVIADWNQSSAESNFEKKGGYLFYFIYFLPQNYVPETLVAIIVK